MKDRYEMNLVEYGYFGTHYSYVKMVYNRDINNTLVIFPPSQELIFPIRKNPWLQINRYHSLIPKNIVGTVFVLGYNPNLTVDTFLAEVAEDFRAFIADNIGPCNIAGISYGGGIAIPFASKFPELTKKLLLIVSTYAISEQGIELCNKIIEYAKKGEMMHVQLVMSSLFSNWLISLYARFRTRIKWSYLEKYMNSPSTLVNAYTHIVKHNFDLKKYIHSIQPDTLIIGGTKDQFSSMQLYKELADAIENSILVLFNNATHTVPAEKLIKTKKLIADFLKI